MPDPLHPEPPATSRENKSHTGAPYEAGLLRAFDKLTSEVLVFLLAYLILLIGVGLFAPALSKELRTLLYALPVLGIAAFVWLQSGSVTKDAENHGVQVWSGLAGGSAQVGGIRGGVAGLLERIKVFSGIAIGRARVIGVDTGNHVESEGAQEGYLLEIFRRLNERDRLKVVEDVLRRLGGSS